MDFEQVLELAPGSTARGGDEADIEDADIVVVAAAVPLTLNTSRLVYLADNARIVDEVADRLPSRLAGRDARRHEPGGPVWSRGFSAGPASIAGR